MSSIVDMLNGLSDIINGKRTENTPAAAPIPKIPDQLIGAPGVMQAPVLGTEWARQASTVLPRIAEGIAAAPTDIWNLANKGLEWATGTENVLPTDTTEKVSDAIHTAGQNVNEWQLDEPRNDKLTEGTPPELMASWAALAGTGLVRLPAAALSKVDEGFKALEAMKGITARSGEYALKGLEMLTPVMVRTPTKLIEAGSVAIPGAIGTGLELAFPDPNPEKLGEVAHKATDASIASAEATAPAQEVVENAVKPVSAGFPSTGNSWLDAAVVGAASVAGYAAIKRMTSSRVLTAIGKTPEEAGPGFRHNFIDINAPMKDAFEQMNPPLGKRFSNKIDEASGAAIDTKTGTVFDYGQIPNSQVRMTPPKDWYTKLSTVTKDEAEVVRKAIISRNAYYDDSVKAVRGSADRTADWAAVQNNPRLRGLVDDFDNIMTKMHDYRVEQGDLTPALRNKLVNEKLYQFEQGRLNLNQKLVRTEGIRPIDPINDLPHFIEQTIRDVEWNKTMRTFINAGRNALISPDKAVRETAEAIFGRAGSNARQDERVIKFRNHNGLADTQEILNPDIRRAMEKGNSRARLHMLGGYFADAARIAESAGTGKLAAVGMHPFAHTAAFYNATFGAALREPGTATGPIDAALQRSGFKFGLPGDPTIYGDMFLRAGQGIGAIAVKRVADAIHRHVVKEGMRTNSAGPQALEKFAQALSNRYKRTWVNEFAERGMLGPSTYQAVNPDKTIGTAVRAMQRANVPARVIAETYGFLGDVLHAISASPGASVWAANKHLHPDLRARAVREFTGDVGRSGAFTGKIGTGAGHMTAATPWGNTMWQSSDKAVRAFGTPKKAASSITGLTVGVGIPTALAVAWTASLGEEYVKYWLETRTPDRAASSIYIPLPGLPPENGLEWSVDPITRIYKAGMEMLAAHSFGLLDGSYYKPENDTVKGSISEQIRNRWLGVGGGSVARSIGEQSILPPLPVGGTAIAAALGVNWRSYLDSNEIHRRNDVGYTSSDARNPFREIMGLHESAVVENIFRSLGMASGQMAYDMTMGAAQRVNEGMASTIPKDAMQQLKLGFRDSTRQVSGALMGSFAAVAPSQEATVKLVREKITGAKQLSDAFQAVTAQGATTGGDIVGNKKIGYQELLGGRLAVEPNDPRALALSKYVQLQLQQWAPMLAQDKVDYLQRNSIQASLTRSPERKRADMNVISEQIIHRNEMMLQQLQQFESQMSSTFGIPGFKLNEMNINHPMSK